MLNKREFDRCESDLAEVISKAADLRTAVGSGETKVTPRRVRDLKKACLKLIPALQDVVEAHPTAIDLRESAKTYGTLILLLDVSLLLDEPSRTAKLLEALGVLGPSCQLTQRQLLRHRDT